MIFDFDQHISRQHTEAIKLEERESKFGTSDVTPLWIADMDFASPPGVTRALVERTRHPVYGYTAIPDSLNHAAIEWYQSHDNWAFQPRNMLWVPGTKPALATAIGTLTQPGDRIIVQPPVYGPLAGIAQGLGRQVIENPLLETNGHYRMDLDHLEACAKQHAKLLILCHPHNPTGSVWPDEDLEALLKLSRRYGLTVFSDAIHADIRYRNTRYTHLGKLARAQDRVISALSPCKTFNLQGLPLTALVSTHAPLLEQMRQAIEAQQLNHFSPFTLVASEAAWREGSNWHQALMAYLETTRDNIVDYINNNLAPLRTVAPEAGYLLWLDARALALSDTQLHHFFTHQCQLGLNPGTDFVSHGNGFMRLNFASPRHHIMQALATIREKLATLHHPVS